MPNRSPLLALLQIVSAMFSRADLQKPKMLILQFHTPKKLIIQFQTFNVWKNGNHTIFIHTMFLFFGKK